MREISTGRTGVGGFGRESNQRSREGGKKRDSSTPQGDAFAGSERGREESPAPLGMTQEG